MTGIARDPYWKQPSYLANSTSRPVESDADKVNEYGGDGFDLAWAVGADGMPVALDSIHYIKVQTASDMIAGAIGEKSTEVNVVARAVASDKDVGVTTAPTSIMIDNNKIDLSDDKYVYNATVSGVFDVAVTAGNDDNVYINNKRASDINFKDIPDHEIIRVIVQNGEKEPLIYYISVTDDGKSTDNQVTAITFDADGGKIGDYSSVTRYYDVNSSAAFPTPAREGIPTQ